MPKSQPQLSIAIIGAGISSLCLARGLLKHAHLSVRIYEARHAVGQHDGSGIGIAANGQNALELLDPELLSCLHRAGGVEMEPTVRFIQSTGAEAGEVITDVFSNPPQRTVRRVRLLDELRKVLPDGVVVTGKRLVSIERDGREKALKLSFEDGEVVQVDAVIGADGINSIVRRQMDHEESQPVWVPGFNTRIVIPMAEAKAVFGEEYCAHKTQVGWIGQDGFCLTDVEDDGNAMQVIASLRPTEIDEQTYGKAFVEVEKDFWTSKLQAFGWIGEKISRVMENQEKVYASCFRRHDDMPAYYKGRVCLAGDAAGSFSPALGAGASQAIEDALILSTVLGYVNGAEDLEKAFRVYNGIRYQRRKRVAMESNKQGRKITGQMEGVGMDRPKLAQALQEPYEYLFGYNLEGSAEEARRMMEQDDELLRLMYSYLPER